ncbi:hypothetical protein FIBSPDRAFT_914360 [Athelia psychrophila]|uniref:DUF6589 domain-containing protein n=1 Tax=Athelia psychrophila TaxID=1759441 RepID=A0A165WXX2_9AGAM|nr:hypothetical protein FIBSPDRAFT_914360 [Fibularhizoctonia sp. CBS 109695]
MRSGPSRGRTTVRSSDIEDSSDSDESTVHTPTRRNLFDLSPAPRTPRPNTHNRAQSLPPLSSDGIIKTSPIVGTAAQRTAIKRKKGQHQRLLTNTVGKEEREKEIAMQKDKAEKQKTNALNATLASLDPRGLTWSDLMTYVFDPVYKQGRHRYSGFFNTVGAASKILNHWISPQNPAHEEVHEWAVGYVERCVAGEGKFVNEKGFLHSKKATLSATNILNFSMQGHQDKLRKHAGVAMRLFEAFATSPRQKKPGGLSAARWAKKATTVTCAALMLLGEFSQRNNLLGQVMGLYMYASGAQKQVITVLSHLGLTESYSSITRKPRQASDTLSREPEEPTIAHSSTPPPPTPITPLTTPVSPSHPTTSQSKKRKKRQPKPWDAGTLRVLSNCMRTIARSVAATGLFGTVYDNINMVFRTAEQVIGRTDSQENGTCATIWPLWNAKLEDMKVSDLQKSFDLAPPLTLDQILLNPAETLQFDQCLLHCILRILVTHGGEKFKKFSDDLKASQPQTEHVIGLHKTDLHPLPGMNIDESTIVGNAEVVTAILTELGLLDGKGEMNFETLKIFAGDQLSIARLRALLNIRAGHEGKLGGYGWGLWMPGLFHAKIADMHGFFVTHWGKPNAGTRNPGSLSFHNTVLHRNPILLTSLPPFRTLRDLTFVSLYARVLHCLLLVSGKQSLDEYADSATWKGLQTDAEKILHQHKGIGGDMVLENAILFLRDALISREFTDAVKAGDSGCVLLVLKVWALSFRGSGRTKYAYEMLHLIHNLSNVWPKPVCKLVLDNWLLNPTGKPNSWVEVDLMQEHMNYWIKNFYKAHGSSASWEWLEMIAPCVEVLRNLAKTMNGLLGVDSGIQHEPVDLTTDIPELMTSLDDLHVYREHEFRVLDDDDPPTIDIITAGLQSISDSSSNPVDEFCSTFSKLQARSRLTPVVGGSEDLNHTPAPPSNIFPTPVLQPTVPDDSTIPSPTRHSDDEAKSSDSEPESENDNEVDAWAQYRVAFEEASNELEEPTLTRDRAEDVALDMDEEDYDSGDDDYDDDVSRDSEGDSE